MGLRQSKRSVDISGSPKKESPVAVAEKIPEINHEVEKADESIKSSPPANGETKLSDTLELVIFFIVMLYKTNVYMRN